MRDPNRIEPTLRAIGEIWKKCPDLRLGQLIGNVLEGASLYYVEDDGLVNAIKDMYEGKEEPVAFDNDAYIFDLIKENPEEISFVLQSKDYEEYKQSYETVPGEDIILSEDKFNNLKNFFNKLEENKKEGK